MRAGDLQQLERIAHQFPTRERFLSGLALAPPQASSDLAGAPLRYYVTQQSRRGDAHVYGARSRFMTRFVLAQFEPVSWPAAEAGVAAPAQNAPRVYRVRGSRIDVQAPGNRRLACSTCGVATVHHPFGADDERDDVKAVIVVNAATTPGSGLQCEYTFLTLS